MTRAGKRLIDAAREAAAIAKGDRNPARLHVPPEIDVRSIRSKLGLSQEDFVAEFGFTSNQIQDWEQGLSHPLGSVRAYLMIINTNPKVVLHMIQEASTRSEQHSKDAANLDFNFVHLTRGQN